ncbi:class D sortase [Evansella cellulosilytica]|uniref:Sortase family protein n=1 Tax=Evansella cellulosilytica (strain ATCC 21833 / DSM 2522 / FERM P-1141 / JCM 9156 / N-4) TaxID=649639 RepID=E6TQV2_EVAC2|nr:class D sortase [Evansella cellulosilytica]ADU31727.1 sortase family protein [Evansella cellulosilytica DSM 2522]
MKKWIGIIFIMTSLIFFGIGGYQFYEMNTKQNDALKKAQSIVYAGNDERNQINVEDALRTFQPERGETIGMMTIPLLDLEYPIVEGTEDEELKSGVGHFIGTGFPGQDRQILMSGHRDTVFRDLGELVHGDVIEVNMSYGAFQYEIVDIFIVDKDDRTVIDYSIDYEVLTLSTCYPFRFVGDAPERYIIQAKPVTE